MRNSLLIRLCLGAILFFNLSASLQAQVRIMPLGNSITFDNNTYHNLNNTPLIERKGYRRPLDSLLTLNGYAFDFVGSQQAGDPNVFDIDNEGYPGMSIDFIKDRVYNLLTANPAQYIMLHIGTNDLGVGTPASRAQKVADLLDEVDRYETDNGVEITVLLAKIINVAPNNAADVTNFNAEVELMAQDRINNDGDKIVVVDMEVGAGLVYQVDDSAPYNDGDFHDNLHPNDNGYVKMAHVWYGMLQPLLDGSPIVTTPAKPTNLALSLVGGNFELDWTDNSNNEDYFVIEHKADGDAEFSQLDTASADITTYSFPIPDTLIDHQYRVKAKNIAGISAPSNIAEWTYTPPPPPAGAFTFYRAINLGGNNITIEGNDWEPSWAGNLTVRGNSLNMGWIPLVDAPSDADKVEMLGKTLIKSGGGTGVDMLDIPNGTYQVYLWIMEWENNKSYDILINGATVESSFGLASTEWEKIGPYEVEVTDGTISVETVGDQAALSGFEVWEGSQGPPDTTPPSVPTNLMAYGISQTSLTLNWYPATDEVGVVGYDVFQGNTKLNTEQVADTSFEVTGLLAETAYEFTVIAKDAAGNSSDESEVLEVSTLPEPPGAPDAPSNLILTLVSSEFQLTWNDTSDDEEGFVIEHKVGNGSYSFLDSIDAELAAYSYPMPDTLLNHSYRIKAWNMYGASEFSNVATWEYVEVLPDPPAAPTNLVLSINGGDFELTWVDNASDEEGFVLQQKAEGEVNFSWLDSISADVEVYSFPLPDTTKDYSYRLKAWNEGGESALSNTATWDYIPPTPPVGEMTFYRAINLGGNNITIEGNDWEPNWAGNMTTRGDAFNMGWIPLLDAPADANKVEMLGKTLIKNGGGTGVDLLDVPNGTYQIYLWIMEWENNKSYDILVNGVTVESGFGLASTAWTKIGPYEVEVTDGTISIETVGDQAALSGVEVWEGAAAGSSDTTPPSVPTGLIASEITQTSLKLTWLSSTDDDSGVAGYYVFEDGNQLNGSILSDTSFDVTSLSADTEYDFMVKAEDIAGNISIASATLQVSTLPEPASPPAAPSSLMVSESAGILQLSWQNNDIDIDGFVMEYKAEIDLGFTFLANISKDLTEYTTATPDTVQKHYFRIRAYEGADTSEYSNIAEWEHISIPTFDGASIVTIGNSITQGASERYSYRYELWELLDSIGANVDFVGSETSNNGGNTSYPNLNFDKDHEGHWGWRADEILANLPTWLNGYDADIALIHLGTNDILQGQDVASTILELEQIIDVLRADNPNVVILLAQIIPNTWGTDFTPFNNAVAGIPATKSTANSPVILVDQATGFDAAQDTYDGVHPTPWGEIKMGRKWFETLVPLLNATPPLDPPSAPTNLLLAVNGSNFELSWSDNSDNESGFVIEQKAEGEGSFSWLDSISSDLELYVFTLPDTTQDYSYRIKAWNADGESGYSNEAVWEYVAPLPNPPSAPSNLVLAVNGGNFELSWSDNSDNESGFVIGQKVEGKGSFSWLDSISSDLELYTFALPDTTQDYSYRVKAWNSDGESAYSNEAVWEYVAPLPNPPSAPSNLVLAVNGGNFELSWSDNSDNESGFIIEQKSEGEGSFSWLDSISSDLELYAFALPDTTQDYSYRIKAWNADGESGYSNEAVWEYIPPVVGLDPVFYRAINFAGNNITIDGNDWEPGWTGNMTVRGGSFNMGWIPLVDAPTDANKNTMLGKTLIKSGGGTGVDLTNVPDGSYDVYLWMMEWENNKSYDISINGNVVESGFGLNSSEWMKLGPYQVEVSDGEISIETIGDQAAISGIEVWSLDGASARTAAGDQLFTGQLEDNISIDHFFIYPNPSQGDLNIEIPAGLGEVSVSIFDYHGKLYINDITISGINIKLDLARVPSGVYLLKIASKNKTWTKKILRQ
ncbi:fibronectin type III domain-containing protein [Flammeovirgaceae bacterium SG7u.111]|nr:fibronectin type III domain-containing protein [Flammeovirgaceae bacterium SG7u.132]WPO34385.1 fibronectin type III domain-containing protein [Flammeovirgaceae bacterium SG7u.111]